MKPTYKELVGLLQRANTYLRGSVDAAHRLLATEIDLALNGVKNDPRRRKPPVDNTPKSS